MKKNKPPVKPTEKQKAKSTQGSLPVTSLYLICFFFAFLLYSNTLNHQFAYDDFPTIYGNQLTMQGVKAIPTLLHTSYWYGLNNEEDWLYRPLSMVMFAVEWQLAPNTPALGHWINVLLYVLSAFLLMRFLCNLFEGKNILLPFAVTLIWIAHPIHTEVVANIKSRDEILCFLFCILTLEQLLRYIKVPRISALIKACVFYFLALMSKESAITMLVLIPLMIYFFSNASLKQNMMISVIALLPATLYMIIRAMVLSSVLKIADIPLSDNALIAAHGNFNLEKGTAFYILGLYLKLIFFPHPLSMDYSFNEIPLVGLSNPVALFSMVVFAALLIYAFIFIPKKDPIAFGILFFIIPLSLVANVFFLTRSTMAERFLYMPSLGFSLVIVLLAGRLFKIDFNTKVNFNRIGNIFSFNKKFSYILCAVLFAASIRTIARNPDWKNDTSIFSADVLNAPNSTRMHFLYANHLVQDIKQNHVPPDEIENDYNLAIEHYNQCLAIDPDHYQSYLGLADVYKEKNNPAKALTYYLTIVQRLPKLPLGYYNLGNMYFRLQQYDSSIAVLKKAIALQPNYANTYNDLGSAYFSKGNFDDAVISYKKALEIKPDHSDAWKNLGNCYGARKDYDNAIAAFQKASSFAPDDADIKRLLDLVIQLKRQAEK